MTNRELLYKKIEESGLRMAFIYEKLGIARSTWCRKCNNTREFNAEEISNLCNILRIKSKERREIFGI